MLTLHHWITPVADETKAVRMKYLISIPERKQLIKECGDAAVLLFNEYMRFAALGHEERKETDPFDDRYIANRFGWTESKAKRIRLKLKDKGWIFSHSQPASRGRFRHRTYVFGKRKVAEFRKETQL